MSKHIQSKASRLLEMMIADTIYDVNGAREIDDSEQEEMRTSDYCKSECSSCSSLEEALNAYIKEVQ